MTSIHSIRLTTRDGAEVRFDCAEDEAVTAAAARAGLILPTLCGSGGCGTCRASRTDGVAALGPHSATALPAEAADRGEVLLCRTFPRSDLVLTAPFDRAHILDGGLPERGATVTAVERAAADTVRLVLQLDPHEELGGGADFEPGQYMELAVPGTDIRRAYSIASPPNWDGTMEFLIRLQPGGRFSGWLAGAAAGARLTAFGPAGHFTLQERGMTPRWFLAGGTGLAPMLSMLRRMAEWGEMQEARLFYGVNREDELCADAELSALAAALPDFTVVRCVRQPGEGWDGAAGTPVDALEDALRGHAGPAPDLYVCGPPAMVEAVKAAAARHRLPDGQVLYEAFLPSGAGETVTDPACAAD